MSSSKRNYSFSEKVGHGKFDTQIIELFVHHNLDLMDFVSGPFRGSKSVYGLLAVHLNIDWKDKEIRRELFNILSYNKRSIRDKITEQQEALNLPLLKGKLPSVEFCGFFDEELANEQKGDGKLKSTTNTINSQSQNKRPENSSQLKPNDSKSQKKSLKDKTKDNPKLRSTRQTSTYEPIIDIQKHRLAKNTQTSSPKKDIQNQEDTKASKNKKEDFRDKTEKPKNEENLKNSFDIIKENFNKSFEENIDEEPTQKDYNIHEKSDRIKNFIKENCQDDEIQAKIKNFRKILIDTNLKYQIDPLRSSKKMKARIDLEVHLAEEVINASKELIKDTKATIIKFNAVINGRSVSD